MRIFSVFRPVECAPVSSVQRAIYSVAHLIAGNRQSRAYILSTTVEGRYEQDKVWGKKSAHVSPPIIFRLKRLAIPDEKAFFELSCASVSE